MVRCSSDPGTRIRGSPVHHALPLMSATGCTESSEPGYTVAEAAELEPGDNVCVREGVLQSRPDLAGRLGMVVAPYNPSTGRIAVQVEDEAAPMALKPHALEGSGLPDGVRRMILPAAATAAAPKRRRVSSNSGISPRGGSRDDSGATGRRKDSGTTQQEVALFARVHEILSRGNLNTMTLREVRQQLSGCTPAFSAEFLAENKSLIKRMVAKAIPQLQQQQQQPNDVPTGGLEPPPSKKARRVHQQPHGA